MKFIHLIGYAIDAYFNGELKRAEVLLHQKCKIF